MKVKLGTSRPKLRAGFAATPPDGAAPARPAQELPFAQLKEQLLREFLAETVARPDLNLAYRRAADDASSLVWVTGFPLLLFPALFREKAAEARQRANHQRDLLM